MALMGPARARGLCPMSHCGRPWGGALAPSACAVTTTHPGDAGVSPRVPGNARNPTLWRVPCFCTPWSLPLAQDAPRSSGAPAHPGAVWAGLNGTPGAHRLPCHGHPPRERGRAPHGVGRGAQPPFLVRAAAPPWILICAVLTPFSPHTGPRSRVVSWGATGCYPRAPTGVRRRRVPHGCVARGRTPHAGATGRSARGIPPLVPSRGSPRLPPGACSVRHGGGARRTLARCGRA